MSEASASGAAVLHADEGVIETSCSCVVVRTYDLAPLLTLVPENNPLVKFLDGDEADRDLLVQTADQWGPFSVSTRLLDGPPGEPGPEWEDVVELSVTTPAGLFVTELVDNDPQIELVSEPGEYRLRVSGRGRSIPDEDEEDEDPPPKEWYLFEMWAAPRADPVVVRLTSPWAERHLNTPAPLVIPEAEAGLAASVRIGRDVDRGPGARALAGRLGSVRVSRTILGSRRRLFTRCAFLTTWSSTWLPAPSWSFTAGGGVSEWTIGHEHWAWGRDHADQLAGSTGAIRWTFMEVARPARVARAWNWVRRSGDRGPSRSSPESTSSPTTRSSPSASIRPSTRARPGRPSGSRTTACPSSGWTT